MVTTVATVFMMSPEGVRQTPADDFLSKMVAQNAALQSSIIALTDRVMALEARPEEVAHFGATARLPTAAALANFTVTLTGLVPARHGDVLKANEAVTVTVPAGLPAGVSMRGPPTVPADGTVVLSFTASVALSSAATLTFAISALR